MSRTQRHRKNKSVISKFEWDPKCETSRRRIAYYHPTTNIDKYIERSNALLYCDRQRRMFTHSLPRYHRHIGVDLMRRRERDQLIRCLKNDTWDSHIACSKARTPGYYW